MTRRRLLQNPKRAQRPRLRKPRLFLEMLEDRTLLSNGQWLVDIGGLPGNTRDVQMSAAQQLFQQDGIDPNLQVVNHLGADGVLLVQAPTSYTQQMVAQALAPIQTGSVGGVYHTLVDVEEYDPNKDPGSYNVVFPPPPDDGPGQNIGIPPGGGSSSAPGPFVGPGGPNGPGGPDVGSITGFKGIDSTHSFCGCSPPDTDGAVGPSSFVQHVNTSIALYDKSGNLLPGTSITPDSTFYASIHKGNDSFSDPTTVYDEFTHRFVTTELEFGGNNMFLDVATSTTDNPTSLTSADWTFRQYNINDGFGGFDFADYPKVGYNADGLVYSFNMFPNFFDHVSTISIRNDGSSPGIHIVPGGMSHFTLAPATMHSSNSGDPMWFVEDGHTGGGGSTVTATQESDPFGAQIFTSTAFSVTSYGDAPNPRQPGGSLGGRTSLGTRFYFSDLRTVGGVTHLVSAHTVGANGGAQARWYDFTISGGVASLHQQGSIDQGAGVDTYFPSIAIAPDGSLGMTFSESSNTENMSMYVTGRKATDPLGSMQTPILVKAGTGFLNAFGRAGDYSATTVDPTDGSFWATNEWADGSLGSPNWSTWIDHFNVGISPPPPPSPGAITGRVFDDPLHNGADNPGNKGLESWLVYLDVKHTGQFDPNVDPYQITDATGSYTFDNLNPGTYYVGEVLLPNYVESAPPPPGEWTVIVGNGQTVKNVDFGNYQLLKPQNPVDDADPVNFQTNGGDWLPDPRGFNGGSQTNAVNTDPTENAQWTVTTGKGTFELFATWANDPSFASNATYEIFDGTKLLGKVVENQQSAPTQADYQDTLWNKLGTFTTTTGAFTIQVDTFGANGTVDADAVFAAGSVVSTGAQLIKNGGFEDNGGSFTSWTHVNESGGSGDWYIQSGTSSPISGFQVPPPPGPTHAAMTDTFGPGSHVLYQDFTIPVDVTSGTLSFNQFIGNRAGAFYTPASLDFNGPPNQQARVDIIKTSANVFSVAPSDVLLNIYQTKPGDPLVSGYTPQTTDLSSFLVTHAGQTVRLRFAEVDNQLFFQFGIDDVSLTVKETGSVASGGYGGVALAGGVGAAGPASAAPSTASGATNTSNAPAGVVGNASTSPSVSPLDNLFISMGNGAVIVPITAPIAPPNGNTPASTGAAFNTFVTSVPKSESNTDLIPGDGGDGKVSSQDQLL